MKKTKKTFDITRGVIMLLVLSVVACVGSFTATRSFASEQHVPVILVHGYNNRPGNCQGIDLNTYWKNTKAELTNYVSIPAQDVIPVSYYKCDLHGYDMTGYSSSQSYALSQTTGTIKTRATYSNDTSITRIAQDLSWFIYDTYTTKSQPVYVVGHSMGGLIAREALRHVQAGDPAFPPSLDVRKVVTISTPHNGWGTQCTQNTQCAEMSDGSTFITDLQSNPAPQGSSGTSWWAMGLAGVTTGQKYLTSSCDFIPTESAIAVQGTHLVYTKPCYKHNGYLTDISQKLDAVGSPEIGGRHSLAMLGAIVK